MECLAVMHDRKSYIGEQSWGVTCCEVQQEILYWRGCEQHRQSRSDVVYEADWFQVMELAMKARLPSIPREDLIACVNSLAPTSNSIRFCLLSESNKNNMVQRLVKWKKMN